MEADPEAEIQDSMVAHPRTPSQEHTPARSVALTTAGTFGVFLRAGSRALVAPMEQVAFMAAAPTEVVEDTGDHMQAYMEFVKI
jgi:hypothetical protein